MLENWGKNRKQTISGPLQLLLDLRINVSLVFVLVEIVQGVK